MTRRFELQVDERKTGQASGGLPASCLTLTVTDTTWRTPGACIAHAVLGRSEVRLVAERLERDRFGVFVVLYSDPEEVLDAIFDAEHLLYERFSGLPFDVRVMVPGPEWSDEDLRRDTVVHYENPSRATR